MCGPKSHSTWNDPIIGQKFRDEPSENAQEHQSLCEIMFNDVLNAMMGNMKLICVKRCEILSDQFLKRTVSDCVIP